mgnify:CR=1 FL=1|jgi:hypothetical protein
MIERFFNTLMNDEVVFSSLSQIGLLSLIVIASFLLMRSAEKDSEKQENNKKEEVYTCDDVLITGLGSMIVFTISSLLLFGEIFRVFLRILLTFIETFA